MLLAGRCRKPDEAKVIQEVIERHMKRKINLDVLFGADSESVSQTTAIIIDKVVNVVYSTFTCRSHFISVYSCLADPQKFCCRHFILCRLAMQGI